MTARFPALHAAQPREQIESTLPNHELFQLTAKEKRNIPRYSVFQATVSFSRKHPSLVCGRPYLMLAVERDIYLKVYRNQGSHARWKSNYFAQRKHESSVEYGVEICRTSYWLQLARFAIGPGKGPNWEVFRGFGSGTWGRRWAGRVTGCKERCGHGPRI